MAMGDQYREQQKRPPKAKAAPRSGSNGRSSWSSDTRPSRREAPGSAQRQHQVLAGQAVGSGGGRQTVQIGGLPKVGASFCSDVSSAVSADSFDPRMEIYAGYPSASSTGCACDDIFNAPVASVRAPPQTGAAASSSRCTADGRYELAHTDVATSTIQRWWRRQVGTRSARPDAVIRSNQCDALDAGAVMTRPAELPVPLDCRPARPGSDTGVPGIQTHGQLAQSNVATNFEDARIPRGLGCDGSSDGARPYCPSRYEDSEPSSGAVDRVAQLRSRVRSIQESRGSVDAGETFSQEAAAAASSAPAVAKAALSTQSRSLPSSWQPSRASSQTSARPPETQDKLSSILSFLDEVEESSRADICSLVSSARSSRAPGDPPEASGELAAHSGPAGRAIPLGLANDAFALQSRVSMLEVEVGDKKQIINALKHAVAEAKERERQSLQEVARDSEEKAQKTKSHYEAQLERQLQLVDRLLNDKTELTKRCELFSEELKAVERKFQMKTEEIDEHNSKNLARQKQNWMAAEKLRREAWEKDKTREIKEMTIKGLQPEVERILAERKQEKMKLEERHKEMSDIQRRELLELAQKQLHECREALAKEHEQRLDQEREAHRRKLREEFDKFSAQLQEERSKCAADLLAERRKHEQQSKQEADSLESRLRDAVAAERIRANAEIEGVKVCASDSESKHRSDLIELEERLRAEKEQWQQEHAERTQLDFERREANLREELTKERDRQLEVLVDRLGREHLEQQHLIKKESAVFVDQVRTEGADQASRLSGQLEEVRAQVAGSETERALLQQTVRNLESRLEAESKRIADAEARTAALEADKDSLQKAAEKSLETHREELWRLTGAKEREAESLQQEVSRLNARVSEERARAEELQKEAKQREEQIIGDLEARVKRTLQAKEDTIGELRTRCAASDNRAREFEYLLARQREELLSGITKDISS